MTALTTPLVAGLSLLAGFAVASVTGVRALGGAVLLAAAVWCAVRWWRLSPLLAVVLVVAYVGAFVLSHVLADPLGAWPAVLTVAAGVTGLALLGQRETSRR